MCNELTNDECDILIATWRICCFCEKSINKDQIGRISECQCLYHLNCHDFRVGNGLHLSTVCSLQLKRDVISGYVKKTFNTGDVAEAFRTHMEQNCTLPWKKVKRQAGEQREMASRLAELEKENDGHKQKYEESQASCERLGEKLEKERTEWKQKMEETRKESDRTTAKLAQLSMEIREVKKQWKELPGDQMVEEKLFEVDEANFSASDGCLLEYEYHAFKEQFTQLQKKFADLGSKACSTGNWKLICRITGKISSTSELSSKINDQVLDVLKSGSARLKNALDDLIPFEAEFPTSSVKKTNENNDEKFLE